MSDADALLESILLFPEEDTPRLVYADWLQENGYEKRAAFIRVQCQPPTGSGPHKPSASCECQTCQTVRREVEFYPLLATWTAFKPFPAYSIRSGGTYSRTVKILPDDDDKHPIYAEFARGFVASVTCNTTNYFLTHAGALFAHHPIERVHLPHHSPHWSNPGFIFERAKNGRVGRDVIPAELCRHWPKTWRVRQRYMPYKEDFSARNDLSRACVAFGKAEAAKLRSRPCDVSG